MNLIDIQSQLMSTQATMAEMEKAASVDQNSRAINLAYLSMKKRYESLQDDFRTASAALGIEACNYRIFSDESPSAYGVASALATFQNGISVIYDAITNGPKRKGRYGVEVEHATRFNFGYCYSGSVGIVLTIPSDRGLFDDSILDDSFKAFSRLAQAKSRDDIKELKEVFGLASIRAVYRWIKTNSESGLGADIKWEREKSVKSSMYVQPQELSWLKSIIDETSEEEVSEISITGKLIGFDGPSKTFRMETAKGKPFRGSFTDAITEEHRVESYKKYKAKLRVSKKIHYATEQEDVTYFLLSINPA